MEGPPPAGPGGLSLNQAVHNSFNPAPQQNDSDLDDFAKRLEELKKF